jgi:hypothetical protein
MFSFLTDLNGSVSGFAEPFSAPDRCSAALHTEQVRNTLGFN